MAGISSKASGGIQNKIKFQNQEFNDDFGANYYEFKWRHHDPQIGRFIQIDPLAIEYVYNSTYAFSENRVIDGIELEGLEWRDAKGNILYTNAGQPFVTKTSNYSSLIVTPVNLYVGNGEKVSAQSVNYLSTNPLDPSTSQNEFTFNCHGHSMLVDGFVVDSKDGSSNKLLLDRGGFDQNQKISDVMNTDMSAIKDGNILAMVDKDGTTIHSAVWNESAGKFSTKNGIGEDTKLMSLAELQAVYPESTTQGFIVPIDNSKRQVNVDVNSGRKNGTSYLKNEQQLKDEIKKQ